MYNFYLYYYFFIPNNIKISTFNNSMLIIASANRDVFPKKTA